MKLSLRQKLSYLNHLFKVLTRDHHKELQSIFRPFIPQDGIVFDVGGHAGQFAKLFSTLVPNGEVFSFEPSTYSRSILQTMVGLKYLSNVYVLPVGLSDSPQQGLIHTPIKKQGSLGYGLAFVGSADGLSRKTVSSKILLSSIDQIVESLALDRVDFIKADIEGSELLMLQGGIKTLSKFHPALFIEVNDEALKRNKHSSDELFDFLKGIGYKNFTQVAGDYLVTVD